MIPTIAFDFNFDYILVLIFASYVVYGYFSGGHKQIRLSINLILPFMIIYYLGRYITSYMYIPLSETFIFDLIGTYMGIVKNTFGMMIAYVFTYVLLFVGVFFLSIYARRYLLNENMRAKLGIKNNYLGAVFAFINGYVLIYFIILPVFSLNLVGNEAFLTNFVLEHPPPFSRIARTAEKAVPIKGLADKADDFQQLLSVEGVEGYYNEAIYEYQQEYIGGSESLEAQFMENVYEDLSADSLDLIREAYEEYFDGEALTGTNYLGISRVLVEPMPSGNVLYKDLLVTENAFEVILKEQKAIYEDYEAALLKYDTDLENYEYQVEYEGYESDLEVYLTNLNAYLTLKLNAAKNGTTFTTTFSESRPTLSEEEPENYKVVSPLVVPSIPELSQDITDAEDFVDEYGTKKDVTDTLNTLGKDFNNHKGLLMWYVDELDREMATTATGGDISETIVSFKNYYSTIIENIKDDELEEKLYLAQMSITSYDVFSIWIACTEDNIDNVLLDDIQLEINRCDNIDPDSVTEYDFTNDALGIVKTLFEGESVSWIIVQYKYDYEAGVFDEPFEDFEEVTDVLASTKSLVDDYDKYYKDIANSIEGNVSMVIKIGIAVMKYNLDVYDTLENTPLLSAFFNDAVRMCTGSRGAEEINRNVNICPKTAGDGGFIKELFNMRYLSSEILFKAYIMVDDENELIIYDSIKMQEFLDKTNKSVEDNIITQEVISMFGDQLAFNVIDETNNYTLLEQMYDDGQISIEAMRILADDDYELFSEEFRARVRSLIR